MNILTALTPEEYAKIHSETSLWQSLEWKSYQESIGRKTRLYGLKNASGGFAAAALVIIDKTVFGLSTWDIPRGPIFDDLEAGKELIKHITEEAKNDRCMTLYFSPQLLTTHYSLSTRHEQPQTTLTLDLTLSDEGLMAQMKPKGRYNIRLAQKKGITVTESNDIDAFYELLKVTSKRDGFQTKPKSHYEKFLETLSGSFLLLAFRSESGIRNPELEKGYNPDSESRIPDSAPIAALLGTTNNKTGIYYYGASDDRYKSMMAPYLLQWEAIHLCRDRGCTTYDLFGIAPNDDPKHPWSRVTRFKKQFGGEIVEYPPEQEVVLRPISKKMISWKRLVLG